MDEYLRDAAFGGNPGADVSKAALGTPRQRWLAAVVLGGQGRYAAATALLTELRHTADPVLASLAASTLASQRRQVGGHAAARRLDGEALARLAGVEPVADDPDGVDAAGALADALTGLAADAIGVGGPARRLHVVAADTVERVGGHRWRSAVRLDWVRAEIELAAGRPEDALEPARRAVDTATAAGAIRHRVKSRMVLAATLANLHDGVSKERAEALLECDVRHNEALGLHPLVWPCALLLCHLRPDGAQAWLERAKGVLSCVLLRADPAARTLAKASVWVP
ncbi:hypothetical protein [Kutzneria kofuensis]|uniref:Uncharacterized protein n=1 Tax=Kutzneria kofuensis TaxID=103725 RepID=A0A7W9KK35_9PSEU|nr:hypothetical protein [Kutzneria kofuensis]MBB5893314.1 hypothetical protein [Kutzneria kofuensis]